MQLSIYHRLTYRYGRAIVLGPQRLQLYPRLGSRQRLLEYHLDIAPNPASRHSVLDVEGNTADWVFFQQETNSLQVELRLEVDSPPFNPFDFIIFPLEGARLPVRYEAPETRLLAPYRLVEDIPGVVAEWTTPIQEESDWNTVPFLLHLSEVLRRDFHYVVREKGPPHPPVETLATRQGSCRDLSLLMIAACRSAGLAARFVSGYAWAGDTLPSHELHAWVEVYLPGAGWRAFDPTMGGAAAETHLALAASADPLLVAPLRGAFWGQVASELETEVVVERVEGS